MIKKVLLLMVLALACVSCKDDKVLYYVISYDPIQLHEEPSENSEVTQLLSLTGGSPRGCFDGFEEGPKRIKVDLHNRPVPVGVRKMDTTGQWGYIKEWFPDGIKGWVKMADVLWCGTGADNELWPAYTVKGKSTEMYRHQRKTNEAVVHYNTLNQGDTVRLLEKRGSWAHVKQFKRGKDYVDFNRLGWVPMSELKWLDSLSVAYVERVHGDKLKTDKAVAAERKAQAAQAKAAEKAKPKSKYRKGGLNAPTNANTERVRMILKKMYGVGAVLAILWLLLFFNVAKRRLFDKFHWKSLAICAAFLGLAFFLAGSSNWYVAILLFITMFAFTYVILYPLIWTSWGKVIWLFLFMFGGLGLEGFAATVMFGNIGMGLVYALASFGFAILYGYAVIRLPNYLMREVLPQSR